MEIWIIKTQLLTFTTYDQSRSKALINTEGVTETRPPWMNKVIGCWVSSSSEAILKWEKPEDRKKKKMTNKA